MMLFKNIQLFQLIKPMLFTPNALATELEKKAFSPCLPTLPMSSGWVSPKEEDYAPLVYAANSYMMVCLQVEDKILPVTVVQQELKEKIKEIETTQQRKVSTKEKYTIKDSIYNSLLPKAFTKKSKIYAYFDTKNNLLIVDTVTEKKMELFLSNLKKSLPNVTTVLPELKKTTTIMTHWLQNNNQPSSFEIGQKCIFQDPSQQGRIIRCQQQDLSASSIQSLMQDGYEVTQIELNWQDKIKFNLDCDFTLKSLKFQDQVIELANEAIGENEETRFDADFVIMTETLDSLLSKLLKVFAKKK